MNDNHVYDARSVANLLLDIADDLGIKVSNLKLQKLLYFVHGIFLVKYKRELLGGYFEAWDHGPVHPQVYMAFKSAGRSPISFRAEGRDYARQGTFKLNLPTDPVVHAELTRVVDTLGRQSPTRLVSLSHAGGGPWEVIANEARTSPGSGIRIPNVVIAERFHRHKVSVAETNEVGADPIEDTPLTH